MRCVNCGAENADGARYCDDCGTPLGAAQVNPNVASSTGPSLESAGAGNPARGAPTANGSVAVGSGTIQCKVCGVANDPSEEFCQNCGAGLYPAPRRPGPAEEATSTPSAEQVGVAANPIPPVRPPSVPVQSAGGQAHIGVPPPVVTPPPVTPPPIVQSPSQAQPAAPIVPPVMPPPIVQPPPVGAGQQGVSTPPPEARPKLIPASPANQPPPAGHARFVVASSGVYFDISQHQRLVIGRIDPTSGIYPEIDLTLHGGDEAGVSRRHCEITRGADQFFVQDLGSSNGTWVKQKRIQPGVRTLIENGDQLRLGRLVLNFYTG